MSLKADPDNDSIVLNSDYEQTIEWQQEKLNLAITILKDISIWCEDLLDAKALARFCLAKIEE